ncbi:MAG: hypothetical protein ACT4NL_12410 [Pseudomarimonas sp.]
MKSSNLRAGASRCSRGILLAAAASASLLSSVSMAAIVTSPVTNLAVPQTVAGVYVNVVTGATGTSGGAVAGWDLNPYLSSGNLGLYWQPTPAASHGGVAAVAAGPLVVLQPGAVIGPASIFNAAIQATAPNFRVTQTGFMGIRFFNEATNAINYGYMQISTTAATGFPATIISIVYENAGTAITIPTPNTPPQFAYNPASGQAVPFTGGTLVGSTGNGSVAVSVGTAGVGTGAASTTTTTCTAPTAPFSGFGQSVTAEGAGAISGGPLSGTCTLGEAQVTQTLTCNESRAGAANARTFTLTCPAGTQPVLTSTPASGSLTTLASRPLGGAASTAPISFQNPGLLPATVTCTQPTNTAFTASPLSIVVPAGGSASTTVSYSSASVGTTSGVLNCSFGGQAFTFNLQGSTLLPAPAFIPTNNVWTLALMAMLMSLLAGIAVVRRQG